MHECMPIAGCQVPSNLCCSSVAHPSATSCAVSLAATCNDTCADTNRYFEIAIKRRCSIRTICLNSSGMFIELCFHKVRPIFPRTSSGEYRPDLVEAKLDE